MYNLNQYLGLKMDLQGYGSNTTSFVIPPNNIFPGGLSGRVHGNLFTYMFGPQIKVRAHNFQPFGHLLLGGGHSNVYGNAFKQLCQPLPGACDFSKAPSANAFAMAVGVGVDIQINRTISFRPGEVDYLLTVFSNPFTNGNQTICAIQPVSTSPSEEPNRFVVAEGHIPSSLLASRVRAGLVAMGCRPSGGRG